MKCSGNQTASVTGGIRPVLGSTFTELLMVSDRLIVFRESILSTNYCVGVCVHIYIYIYEKNKNKQNTHPLECGCETPLR